MKKQSEYRVVSSPGDKGAVLSETVNNMLGQGYILAGGIQVSGNGQLFQSMVKEVETVTSSGERAGDKPVVKKEISGFFPEVKISGNTTIPALVSTEGVEVPAKKKGRPRKVVA